MNFVKELKIDDKFLLNLIKNKYPKMGINSLKGFETYLENNNLDIQIIKEKFTIELIWNDLIFQKFNNKIILDKEKIKNEILQNPKKNRQKESINLCVSALKRIILVLNKINKSQNEQMGKCQ